MSGNPALPMMAAQNRILRTLDHAGARSPDSARSAAELGLGDSLPLEGLIRRKVVERLADGRLFLHPEREVSWRRRRVRRLVVGLALAGLVLLLMVTLRRP